MHNPQRPTVAVLLPGSGSDAEFVAAVFADPLAALGIRLLAPRPGSGRDVVAAMWRALDAAPPGALLGGISLGAHVAARWAARSPAGCAGLLLALPGWLGAPGQAPAAVAAMASADALRRDGIDRTLAAVRSDVPSWVADELERAWRGHGAGLADSLAAAAGTPGPTADELRGVAAPAGVAALTDDPLHPRAVAQSWAGALPRAALVSTSLDAMGRDRAALGRAAVLAWLRAASLG